MTIKFSLSNCKIPSIQLFTETIVDDLANGRSILILLPSGVLPGEIWPLLRSALWHRDFDFEEVTLTDLPSDRSPLYGLSSALQIKWPSAEMTRTNTKFLNMIEQLPDVVYLEGFDQLQTKSCGDWLTFLSEWAQTSHGDADQGKRPMALCIIAGAAEILSNIPETDIHLGVYWWWGFPSALEIKMLCRVAGENGGQTMLGQWREYLLPPLVGSDISLLGYLWDTLQTGTDKLINRLIEYSESRKWRAASLNQWGANNLDSTFQGSPGSLTADPSEPVRELWAHGALSWTPEYGLQLNSAVLPLLGREREVLHRIWRGQAELLLPIIDQVRLKTCEHLTNLYGKSWPYRWEKPNSEEEYEAVRKDPMACQLGYLEHVLRRCKPLSAEKSWVSLVMHSRRMRNELAHYRPVEFSSFKKLLSSISRVFYE